MYLYNETFPHKNRNEKTQTHPHIRCGTHIHTCSISHSYTSVPPPLLPYMQFATYHAGFKPQPTLHILLCSSFQNAHTAPDQSLWEQIYTEALTISPSRWWAIIFHPHYITQINLLKMLCLSVWNLLIHVDALVAGVNCWLKIKLANILPMVDTFSPKCPTVLHFSAVHAAALGLHSWHWHSGSCHLNKPQRELSCVFLMCWWQLV